MVNIILMVSYILLSIESVSATTPHNSSNGKTSFRIFIISETDISTILRISVAPTQISNNVYSDTQMSSPF